MANAKTIKIIINLRQLENGDGCDEFSSSGGGSSSCCCDDPKEALKEARQLGRSIGRCGGCADAKPACPDVKEKPCCGTPPPPPPPKPACPAVKEEPRCGTPPPPPPTPPKPRCAKKPDPPKAPTCGQKKEPEPPKAPTCGQKKEPEPPKAPTCGQKKEPEPPKAPTCGKKQEPEPPKAPTCGKKQEPKPPKAPTCGQKKEPKLELCSEPAPIKCTPPKYLNTDVGPDGKEQQCKEGTSTEGKCRQPMQQRQRGDEYANPASSGGMVQFFKNRFYDASSSW